MLGIFTVRSGTVIVSDPCYPLGIWCQKILENVCNGKWEARINYLEDETRVTCLEAFNVKHRSKLDYIEEEAIGVDSAQAGFFDAAVYRNDLAVTEPATFLPKEPWFSVCCQKTMDEGFAGIIPGGVVSRSGYGDGLYPLYISKDAQTGEIVGMKLVFIPEGED